MTLVGTLAETATGEISIGFIPAVNPRIGEWQSFRAASCTPGGASVEVVGTLPLGVYLTGNNTAEARVFFDDGREAGIGCETRSRIGAVIPVGGTELLEVLALSGKGPNVGECDGERLIITGDLMFDTPRTLTVTRIP
ncbi:MAG TPA: hypothetical protein VFG31_07595 [Conexibacter sp.]|nr:hypothetical protein [Conexibacter sp.]